MKVAIVGCGKIADGHVEQIAKLPHLAKVVAVCDREQLIAEQLATRYGIPHYYGDIDRMLERERPDVIHVTAPPQAHRELADIALGAGCHLFIEKPLGMRYADAAAIVQRARACNRKLTIGYTYLFDPAALALRELLESGALGEPVHLESTFGYDLGSGFGQALLRDHEHWVHRLPGGLIQNNVDHLLNKIAEVIDGREPEVCAMGLKRRTMRFGDARDEFFDELRLMIRGDRVTAYGLFSCHARPVQHSFRIHGTRGTATADFSARAVTMAVTPRLPSSLGRLLLTFDGAARLLREGSRNVVRFARSELTFFAGLEELIRRFYESILNGDDPPIDYRRILWAAQAIERINQELAGPRRAPSTTEQVA